MTPAINIARKRGIEHAILEYEHDSSADSYGLEAAEKLGIDASRVFKTLVVELDGRELVVGVVPVSSRLSMKLIAQAAGAKKAAMADKDKVTRVTGYVLGGVSPLGQKRRLRTFIDSSAEYFEKVCISAGRRGLEIELAPADLLELSAGSFAVIC